MQPPRGPVAGTLASFVISGVATILTMGATGCHARSLSTFGTRSDTAFIGVAVGLQSPERYANVYTGVQLAIDELNAARPAGAPVLALRRAPDHAKTHVDIAAAFRDDPGVIGVVGHTESDPTISAAPIYDDRAHGGKNALVAISPTAASRAVTLASAWIFRVTPVVDRQAEILATYMTDSLHLRRLAIVYRNDVAGREFLQSFARSASRVSLLERDPFVEDIAEFDLYARRLARAKPDGVVIYANTDNVLALARAVHAAGITPIIVSTNGPTARELASDPVAARDYDGLRYLSLYSPKRSITQASDRFAAAFARHYGTQPDHWAALSYDAAMLIGQAAQEVGPNRARIREWVASVGHGAPDYQGATGDIRFDDWRNPIDKPAVVVTVDAGSLR